MARNWPVSCRLPTVMELGMMVSETKLPPVPLVTVDATVTVEAEVTGPLKAVALAVIVVVPEANADTNPDELTVATEGVEEVHVTVFVTFWVDWWLALP